MRPADLITASTFTVDTLRSVADRDWSAPAGNLEWDIRFTVTHVAGGLTKYAVYLAAGATKWSPLVISPDARASNDQLLDAVDLSARALAFAAAHVDRDARAFHAWGMNDASAFLSRGAIEILVHGWDVATGLDLPFEPPKALCASIVARTFPWADPASDPWTTLLTANGRTGEPPWTPLEAPLEEWDGTPPSGGRPPAVAWTWDPDAAQWRPTYP